MSRSGVLTTSVRLDDELIGIHATALQVGVAARQQVIDRRGQIVDFLPRRAEPRTSGSDSRLVRLSQNLR